MKAFDFENNNPIGYVDILPNGNANIDIVGYVDRLNVFHRLNTREAVEFFPPKGRVFAHNFIQKYETYRNRLVCLAVMPNAKDGEGLDSYIWDKSVTVYEYGTRIKTIKANLTHIAAKSHVTPWFSGGGFFGGGFGCTTDLTFPIGSALTSSRL